MLLPGAYTSYLENPWNPVFLAKWRGLNTLRFMDWMLTNEGRVREWSERPTPADATFTARGIPVELMGIWPAAWAPIRGSVFRTPQVTTMFAVLPKLCRPHSDPT